MSKNFEKKMDKLFDWLKVNKDQIIIIMAIIIFLLALIPLVSNYKKKQFQEVLAVYTQVESSYYQNDFKKTIEISDQFFSKYNKKSDMTKIMLFIRGNSFYNLAEYKKAEKIYLSLQKDYPNDYLFVNFIDSLAYCYEMQGNYKKAITTWNIIVDKYSDNYLLSNAYKSIARCYEILGDYKNAEKIYSLIKVMFKGNNIAEFSRLRIEYLVKIGKIDIAKVS